MQASRHRRPGADVRHPGGLGVAALRARALLLALRSRFARVQPAPVFVLGNQRSGTSVIAALLAHASGSTLTLDIRRAIADPAVQLRLRFGLESFDDFVERHRFEFSRQIVKEPALTFLYEAVHRRFPSSRFVFVARDPRENIRSILDRLDVPGSLDELDSNRVPELARSPAWRLVLDSAWLGQAATHYIDGLAQRWNHAADVYLRNSDRMVLVRYEDFLGDKRGTIEHVAIRCGLAVVASALEVADLPYQRAGRRGGDWASFFGNRNLGRIHSACAERMKLLGYDAPGTA